MNEYGRLAQETWRQVAPQAYSQLEDPKSFFSELGEQAASQVIDLSQELAGPDRVGEPYFEKVGRLTASKRQAEEIVRAELLTPPTEAAVQEAEDRALQRSNPALAIAMEAIALAYPSEDEEEEEE